MKALTLTQPYATLIAIGAKQIETRGQKTAHRGEIAIHAGANLRPVGGHTGYIELRQSEPFESVLRAAGYQPGNDLPLGAVVAVADLWECFPIRMEGPIACYQREGIWWSVSAQERAFGDFSTGRYGYMLRTVRRLKQPVPCRGMPGMFDLPADVERAVRAQLSKAPPVRPTADVIESHAARQVEEL